MIHGLHLFSVKRSIQTQFSIVHIIVPSSLPRYKVLLKYVYAHCSSSLPNAASRHCSLLSGQENLTCTLFDCCPNNCGFVSLFFSRSQAVVCARCFSYCTHGVEVLFLLAVSDFFNTCFKGLRNGPCQGLTRNCSTCSCPYYQVQRNHSVVMS